MIDVRSTQRYLRIAGRTLVTLDGVPLNDPFGGWVIWSQAPTESLSGLDIVRGAGAGPWGAGALTGVIHLRERDSGWMRSGRSVGMKEAASALGRAVAAAGHELAMEHEEQHDGRQ